MRRTEDFIKISNLKIFTYHGVLEEEKKNGQDFFLNAKVWVDMRKPGVSDDLNLALNYDSLCTTLTELFTEKNFDLIEAAAEYVVQETFATYKQIQAMELEVRKPSAPVTHMPEDLSITIYREWHTVYLSLGSNDEKAAEYIEDAKGYLEGSKAIRNLSQSRILATKPYGVVDQNDFLNGAMEIETYMSPESLLDFLHEVEAKLGRKRVLRWGPRTIDLDIIFYDDCIYNSKTLTIPHADMENRMFVLEPLSELCPDFRHPVLGKTVSRLKKELEELNPDEGSIITEE